MHFLDENVWILIKISLIFVPKGPVNNIPALVEIMAWRWPGDKPLSEPMMVSLLTYICVTWLIKQIAVVFFINRDVHVRNRWQQPRLFNITFHLSIIRVRIHQCIVHVNNHIIFNYLDDLCVQLDFTNHEWNTFFLNRKGFFQEIITSTVAFWMALLIFIRNN